MLSDDRLKRLGLAFLCTSSAIALSSGAQAQGSNTNNSPETVVVTSSRVIADAANSPTPLTIVTTAQLQATTPTDLSTALNKLPAFVGSFSAATSNNPGGNYSSSSLSLRNFGAERTLVLLDGQRVVPSNPDNTSNVATLPQMLMQRVDVVTGGASAVYGSDAITGVVNFVLDKHFTGWKVDANSGISNYEDGATYNFGIAAGSDLFGGRGHIEGDIRAEHQDNIGLNGRPNPGGILDTGLTGLGTAVNPYSTTVNVTSSLNSYGGRVTCTGCAANGQQFIANGILGPFNPGVATGTSGTSSGGDGGQTPNTSMIPLQASEEGFLRFSYNLTDDIVFHIQGSVNQSYTKAAYVANTIAAGATANTFFVNNPYLTATAQTALANPSGKFTLAELVAVPGTSLRDNYTNALENTDSISTGLDGVWGKYNWSIFYTHGQSRSKVVAGNRFDGQKEWASMDAVAGAGGTIQCYISTTTYASLYPGCVPMNPFGPTAMTSAQFNYAVTTTYFTNTSTLDDFGGSIAGEVFDDWAGPVKAALSFDTRWMGFGIYSTANPVYVDCTGLRLCNTMTPRYGSAVVGLPTVSENVWELAGEVNVPLLKEVPLVQELNVDFAGRYTNYSTSGSVETWKIGLDYHVNDELRFRATNSVDIRAPTLYDLYEPLTALTSALSLDAHTGVGNINAPWITQGNPNLVPEISRTYTAGVVFTPEFIPGLTASIDYYHINLTNGLTQVDGRTIQINQLCQSSGGTSVYCALEPRPLPWSNTTAANIPTLLITENLNAAFMRTEGWDLELNYSVQLGDVWTEAPGSVTLRMLANIQPVLESIPFPTSPLTFTSLREIYSATAIQTSSKGHVTSFVTYNLGSWTFSLEDRWISGRPRQQYWGLYYVQPRVNSVNYQDITIDKKFTIDGQSLDGYLTIENVGNVQPPLNATSFGGGGQFFQGLSGYDRGIYNQVGRFFTLGVRARF